MRYEICGLLGLIAVLNLLPAGRVTAQTFTILHSFTASNTNSVGVNTNGDGANPYTGLIANSSRTTLYGTARGGGNSGNGTVFAVNTDGTGFTNLHSFSALGSQTNSDGAYPSASLILSGNVLYGTAANGGSGGSGTVFALNTNGTGFTNLHSFTVLIFDPVLQSGYPYINSDGAYPIALILSGNTLYGTADEGGSGSSGVLFSLNSDGTGFTNLHTFQSNHYGANEDGVGPNGLILSGSTLYGTADLGAFSLDGTVFAFNSDGAGFTTLHGFTELAGPYPPGTNSDGANPFGGVISSGNTLYGTASGGGSSGNGTVFAVNTNGAGFTTLHSFTLGTGGYSPTNSDGARPYSGLITNSSGTTLYGTAQTGGSSGNGTVFAVNTDGTGFTILHTFAGYPGDGANPHAGLVLSGNTLYGTTQYGGSSSNGTVFSLSFRPQLTIVPSGTNVILTWPVSYAGFSYAGYYLQDTANLLSPTGWSVPDPFPPVIVNGHYTVTRPMLGPQRSYRLTQ